MYFQTLIDETEAVFNAFSDFKKIELPERFAKNQHVELDGMLVLENRFYRLADTGEVRIAHTFAPKINILAVFYFPDPGLRLPVYSMEFVLLGTKPIIALMDMACLMKSMPATQTVKDIMRLTHDEYPGFATNQSLPEWFDQCRSGSEFFFRPHVSEEFHRLGRIHIGLITQLTQLISVADRYELKDALLHKTELDGYKRHHQINSPGLRLMNRSFGVDWTQTYLADYLFG